MILKNSKGIERNFELLFEIEKDNNKYIVYKDRITNNIYAGKENKNKLAILDENEINYLNALLEKMNG